VGFWLGFCWLGSGILLVGLVILAGERKAQIHALVLMVVLMSYRYFDPARVAVFGLVTLLIGVASASMDPYVAQQFTSLAGFGTERYVTPAELQAGYVPISLSNAQRVFAFGVAKTLIAANPIFGIGTDGYLEYVKASFPGSATWLIGGIHNEFLRVLVENGALGFVAFCAIWLRCVGWFFLHKRHMPRSHAVIYLSFFSAFTMQFAFEGSGQEMFIMVIFASLMPDLFSIALKRASATERRGQRGSDPSMVSD
jgi:O-antigen ligase